MKITIKQLRKIIKEELENMITDDSDNDSSQRIADRFVEDQLNWCSPKEWLDTKDEMRHEPDVDEAIFKFASELGVPEEEVNLDDVKDKIDQKFLEMHQEEPDEDDEETKRYKKELEDWEYRDWRSGSDPHYTGPKPKHPREREWDD